MAGAFGQFALPAASAFRTTPPRSRPLRRGSGSLLSAEELATLWHPATATVRAEAMQVTESREREPPLGLPTPQSDPGIAVLGRVKFRSSHEKFGIRSDDRRRHLAIVGKTGMGKTTLLHHLMASDVCSGHGLALLDPHGDLADALLAAIPSRRTNDVLLFDASDRQFPPSYNPLYCPHPEQRGLVASGVVSAFKKLYGDNWGPRLEHIYDAAGNFLACEEGREEALREAEFVLIAYVNGARWAIGELAAGRGHLQRYFPEIAARHGCPLAVPNGP